MWTIDSPLWGSGRRSLTGRFITLFAIFCCACAPIVKTEYITVAVPVRCEIELPLRPVKDNDTVLAVIDLIAYTRKLEVVLQACIGENNEK
jgi:hypothetical protein